MALALPVAFAFVLGLVLGGSAQRLAQLRFRARRLFFMAIGLQIVAFPFASRHLQTSETLATTLWLFSYVLLLAAVGLNMRVVGVPVVGVGMASNIAAILANGGTMPVLPSAMRGAGEHYATYANSTADAHPNLPWLVDRWAAPDWIPFGNVFSIGDVAIAAGAMLLVLVAMGARRPRASIARRVFS